MLSWLLLLLPTSAVATLDKTHGVAPPLIPHYAPVKSSSPPKWKCLDGSKEILWHAVNDDYCDCPDGSDEPGTSACPNSTFYCVNAGHIGASIRSSRVNDGLCEHECCDGSDEQPGACPNVCKEIGDAYRQRMEAENKVRKTGSKIRSTYIAFAKKEKKRLENLVATTSQEVAVREKEVARLKDVLDRTESISAAELEFKKESSLFTTLITHNRALKSLQREHKKLKEKEKTLADILSSLRSGYNPNYQDMAVLEAVRGWEYYAGLPHIGEAEREEGSDGDEEEVVTEEPKEELEEGMWTTEQLEYQLDPLLNMDHVNLLLEYENHIGSSASESLLFDLTSYLPDSLVPSYIVVRDTLVSWLETFGIAHGARDSSAETSQARKAYQDADHSLNIAKGEKQSAQEELARLFDVDFYGVEGEWKKLDQLCLSKDTGEYSYEVCLFGEARQIPNKGGTTFSLGKFYTWHPDVNVAQGTPEYYSVQAYRGGTRCWNGPERSVNLVLICGTENALYTVSEPEKCEYQITGTTPVLCLPLEASSEGLKQEL